MSAAIANSFIFRESYFAEEVLQFQNPSRIGEDEDNNTCGLDYIRKYVEQLTADAKQNAASSASASPLSTATTTAAHAAIKAFDFASIQVSPSPSSSASASSASSPSSSSSTAATSPQIPSNNDATPSSSSQSQHEDGNIRPENDVDLPRYLSWFDDEALASDCDVDDDEDDEVSVSGDDMDQEEHVIFYDEEGEIHDAEMDDEEPLFIGQQAQLQIYEVTKKYKQTLTPDSSLSTSPSSWSTTLSLLAQNCALPIDCDTFKRKSCDSVSEPEKNPSKKIKRWTQQ